ncbi:MAG: hypothetical protein ABFD16_09335, partial [Thermoguttaceae bacterium]
RLWGLTDQFRGRSRSGKGDCDQQRRILDSADGKRGIGTVEKKLSGMEVVAVSLGLQDDSALQTVNDGLARKSVGRDRAARGNRDLQGLQICGLDQSRQLRPFRIRFEQLNLDNVASSRFLFTHWQMKERLATHEVGRLA